MAFGEHVRVVGADKALGGWEVGSAPEMRWSDGHRWSLDLELPEGFQSEYKLVHCMPGKPPVWEYTPNRLLTVAPPMAPSEEHTSSSSSSPTLEIQLQWCTPPQAASQATEVVEPTEEALDEYGMAATPAFSAGIDLMETYSSTESGSASTTDIDEGVFNNQEKQKEMENEVQVNGTVLEVIDAAIMNAEEDGKIEGSYSSSSKRGEQESAFKSAAKTAGAVALGVAGAALLSALAIDVADTAIMGAVAVAAGSAALSSGSNGSAKKKKSSAQNGGEIDSAESGDAHVERESESESSQSTTTVTEPGVIIAAGIMSALDAGKAVVKSLDKEADVQNEKRE